VVPEPRPLISRAAHLAATLAIIAAITWFDFRVLAVNSTTAALTLLLATLAIATRWGLIPATAASVFGVLCVNYFFLPPVGTLTIADPQNWVALLSFLVTSIVASQLSASARNRATEATRRQREMEKLYALSRSLLLLDTTKASVASQLAYQIAQVFEIRAVVLFDRSSDRVCGGGLEEIGLAEAKLRDAAMQGTAFHDAATGVNVLPISLGGPPIGSLAVAAAPVSDAALHAIASLAAITLERARTQELASRAEAVRQNQELKSTLLDALAHEFKTPLTSIKAAVSSLLAEGDVPQKELLTIVEEETDRLDTLVTEAIQMARIEAGQVRLETQPQAVGEILSAALSRADRAIQDRELRVDVPDGLPEVLADRELVGLVIRQLVSNSLKYADPASPIEIRARAGEGCVTITVADRGPGIPEREQARIFERFYRMPSDSGGVPGTGMGLAIARDIIEAHGGALWVRSQAGEGSEFSFTLPCVRPGGGS
jgi:two-component system sensor histidine kinase KdpD